MIVPARNEAPRVGAVLRGLPTRVDRVIVVDDGSTDGTADSARAAGDERLTVLRHEASRGVGAAIVAGYRRALEEPGSPRDALVVMAGDGQMDARDLAPLAEPVLRGLADYAKGNRFLWPDARARIPVGRWLGGQVFSALTARATALAIGDSQCGYTALARSAAEALPLGALYPRYGYPNDLLGLLACARLRVVEVAVRPVYAGEPSGLGLRHLPTIGWLVGRAWWRRRASAGR